MCIKPFELYMRQVREEKNKNRSNAMLPCVKIGCGVRLPCVQLAAVCNFYVAILAQAIMARVYAPSICLLLILHICTSGCTGARKGVKHRLDEASGSDALNGLQPNNLNIKKIK